MYQSVTDIYIYMFCLHTIVIKRSFTKQHNLIGDDGDDDGGGIIYPEHPSPILHAPRDNISRKGNPSLRHNSPHTVDSIT
jgi:hypothetical protein